MFNSLTDTAVGTSTKFNEMVSYVYGSGVDGNVSKSTGTTNITKDMHYNNLSLTGDAVLVNGSAASKSSYRIFVKDTLTLGGTAIINANGNAGADDTAGAAKTYDNTTLGSSAAGGAGGASDADGTAGGAVSALSMGGAGGAGGKGGESGKAGGAGGAATAITSKVGGDGTKIGGILALRNFLYGPLGEIPGVNGGLLNGGAGGGGGGGDDDTKKGGGGGGGGGVVIISAKKIVATGTPKITANGGAGGKGESDLGGGGGGGGGGVVLVYTEADTVEGVTIEVKGGAGGTGGEAGVVGVDGISYVVNTTSNVVPYIPA